MYDETARKARMRLKRLKRALQTGVIVDTVNDDGVTALMALCSTNDHECARLWIDAGAAVDKVNNVGCTALIWACYNGQCACARALIDAGAAVDKVDEDGWTALMEACHFGHDECTRALVDAQADIELTNQDGQNALMVACWSSPLDYCKSVREGRIRCALALLEATAPIHEADFPDWAVSLQFACERLQLIAVVLASTHVIKDAPQLASVNALKTDAQDIVAKFARDRLGLLARAEVVGPSGLRLAANTKR